MVQCAIELSEVNTIESESGTALVELSLADLALVGGGDVFVDMA